MLAWKCLYCKTVLIMIKRSKEITWNIWKVKNPTRIGHGLKRKRKHGIKNYFSLSFC